MTGHRMRVYVDVDDVLSHTTPALCDLLERRTGRRVPFDSLHSFELGESLALEGEELFRFMEAAHAPEHLGSLEPLEGAAEMLARWSGAGAHIDILTGRPPSTHAPTRAWLERHRMAFDRFDCVDKYGRSAGGVAFEEILGTPFEWAVEDNLDVALALARHCTPRVLLLDRPWNRRVEGRPPELLARIERVADWTEIELRVD